jgi:serine/threonine protein phosphatase PrpC
MRTITSHISVQGTRPYQEDRVVVSSGEDGLLLGIFDGHGGNQVSEFCHKNLLNAFNAVADDPTMPTIPEKMKGIFTYLNSRTNSMRAGSTASIVFIPSTLDRAFVGVLGDSPVIIRNADDEVWASPEHNVRSNPSEVAKAKERGGTVYGGYLFARGLSSAGLQMTRVLGDAPFSEVVSRDPEIFELSLKAGSFVLVGSDGLFDPSHASGTAREKIVELIDKGAGAGDLAKYALSVPTDDNVSAILVKVIA